VWQNYPLRFFAVWHFKSNQGLYYCAPKSWPQSWPTLSAAHTNNQNREK